MILRSLYYALFATFVTSTASGYDSWTCRPSQHNTPYTVTGQTAPFFSVRLLNSDGSTATGYTSGISQTVELYSAVPGASIAGVVAAAFTGSTSCPTSCTTVVGSFSAPTGVSYLRQMSRCVGGMTQSSRQASSSFKFAWTAPAAQNGSVSVWAIVVGAGDTYVAISAAFTPAAVSVVSLSTTPTPTNPAGVSVSATPTPSPTSGVLTNSNTPTIASPPSITRVRTASNTPTATMLVSASPIPVSASPIPVSASPMPVSASPMPVSASPMPLSPTTSPMLAAGANYNPSSDALTTSSALSNVALIIAGSMAIVGILFMIYHCYQTRYNRMTKSKRPITITTSMPIALATQPNATFYKRTDGDDIWYVDSKTMQSSWTLPTGGVVVSEHPHV